MAVNYYGYNPSLYGNQGYYPSLQQPLAQQMPSYQSQPQLNTNKIYVTSAEDALSRFAYPNTVTAYFLQDESAIFEVTTDTQGKKNIRTRILTDKKAEETPKNNIVGDFVTRTEFDDFRAKLEAILSAPKVTKKKGVENNDGE